MRDQPIVIGVFAAAGVTATSFDALAHDVQPFVAVEASADYTRDRHAVALTHDATTTGRVLRTTAMRGVDVAGRLVAGQDHRVTQRQVVSSGAMWEPVVGYSRAVRVGSWVWVAGTTAAEEGGGAVGGDDMTAQAREALRRVVAALQQVGARPEHVVRTRMFVTDISRWEEVGRAHGEVFGAVRPATTMVEVSKLIDPALLVEIEADAVIS
jgi:enamine deaminase RidA (YjgF/YER057c/UK114 family)